MADETTGEPVALSQANLGRIAERGVAVPRYDRAALVPGIVHFGPGNFHRAHQGVLLDRLMNRGAALDFAIRGVGTREPDRRLLEALGSQDHLTTVVEQSAEEAVPRVTGPMIGTIGPGETEPTIAALADERTRIVSLTITEGGYYVDADTGTFDPSHPEIAADAASGATPRTVFGLILAGLERRRAAGLAPFTVMSCDNLPHNGKVARDAVVGLASARDAALAAWVEGSVAFPNAMVDRITPATSDRERELLRDHHGISDAAPVYCEDFIQWVLEDEFQQGRPPLEDVGVEFVSDVAPFERMKIAILNGGHAIIAYPAGLLGIHFVHEAMEHPLVAAFLERVEREEIVPHVPPVPNTDLSDYLAKITTRVANPRIGDTVRRLCLDGSNRQPKFIVPSIRARLDAGGEPTGLALASALWCRYCAGTTDAGETIAPNDPAWDRLTGQAATAREEPQRWLLMRDVYGSLGEHEAFAQTFDGWLRALWQDGTEATLKRYLG